MKKYIVIGIVLLIIGIPLFLLTIFKTQLPHEKGGLPIPTKLPVSQVTQIPLTLQSFIPPNETNNVPLNQKITIVFNKPVSSHDIVLSITPEITYDISYAGTSVTISPRLYFQPNTSYTVTVVATPTTYTSSFTTTPVEITPADSAPGVADEINRQKFPDIFIENRTPYETTDFSVEGTFASAPVEHYFFTVTLKGPNRDQSKQAFFNWINSLGLTADQINTLDIRFQ